MSCTLRRNKEAMIKTLKEEYEKRGRPLDSTGWSPKEVRQFMSWQFEVQKPKKKDKIGGFSWLLPEKGSGGRPAALPTEVRNHSAASRNIWGSNILYIVVPFALQGFNLWEYFYGGFKKLNKQDGFSMLHKQRNAPCTLVFTTSWQGVKLKPFWLRRRIQATSWRKNSGLHCRKRTR